VKVIFGMMLGLIRLEIGLILFLLGFVIVIVLLDHSDLSGRAEEY
jgi:hypothetical protein